MVRAIRPRRMRSSGTMSRWRLIERQRRMDGPYPTDHQDAAPERLLFACPSPPWDSLFAPGGGGEDLEGMDCEPGPLVRLRVECSSLDSRREAR